MLPWFSPSPPLSLTHRHAHTHNALSRKAGRAKLSQALVDPLNRTFREEVEVEYQYLDRTLTITGNHIYTACIGGAIYASSQDQLLSKTRTPSQYNGMANRANKSSKLKKKRYNRPSFLPVPITDQNEQQHSTATDNGIKHTVIHDDTRHHHHDSIIHAQTPTPPTSKKSKV